MVGLTANETWTISQQAWQKREKVQALSLAKECYSMRLEQLLAVLEYFKSRNIVTLSACSLSLEIHSLCYHRIFY
ncbi:MAG: hypothetical protein JO327_01205 [Nitrososphaeraceae archaeon]|nr:hypothetical protein [Nitrososphaeraceae archaeon]